MPENPKISVGICAHNEEWNIAQLLRSIIDQKEINLHEIIIVSDGSTDNTVAEINTLNDERIKVVANSVRIGKPPSQQIIFDTFEGDTLLMIDADSMPSTRSFIADAVSLMLKSPQISLLCPLTLPLPAQNLFERIVNTGALLRRDIVTHWNQGRNILACHGVARFFARDFAQSLRYEGNIGEDAYTYLWCIARGKKMEFTAGIVAYYKSPSHFKDYLRQSHRFKNVSQVLGLHMDINLIKKEMRIPFKIAARSIGRFFMKHPLFTLSYCVLLLATRCIPSEKIRGVWEISASTKKLTYDPS
jgi:glycosyltransferase involved in cell wall biosynthesis